MICKARSKEEVQYALFDGTQESAIDVQAYSENYFDSLYEKLNKEE